MKHHKYLIVGGGMTADSTIRGIRKIDTGGTVAMISDERDPPYDRPPLSKSLWKDKPFESIWRNPSGLDIDLHLGKQVVALDARKNRWPMKQETTIPMKNCCSPPAVPRGAWRMPTRA